MGTITVCVTYRRGMATTTETITCSGTDEDAVTRSITNSVPKKGWRTIRVEVIANTFKV